MSEQRPSTEERERLDRLRRRLYRPDATEDDRRAYAHLAGRLDAGTTAGPALAPASAAAPAAAAGSEPAEPHRRESRWRWRLLAAVGAVAVVALAAVATLSVRSGAPRPSAAPTTDSVWSGAAPATAAPIPTPIVVERGGVRHPAQQTLGGASAIVPLRLDSAPRGGGRLVVALTSSDPEPIGWLAERQRSGSHDADAVEVVATEPPALRQGVAAPTTVAYAGAPPSQLVVRAPEGTGWTLTVAFLPPSGGRG